LEAFKFVFEPIVYRKYHDCIAMVSQEPDFFGRSIRENIAYGSRRSLSDEEILEAAKIANAASFIRSFRTGLDTQVKC
jgi:ABC-type multidrug transport system fused ATPase/permease subunit